MKNDDGVHIHKYLSIKNVSNSHRDMNDIYLRYMMEIFGIIIRWLDRHSDYDSQIWV